jgi:hypothetical protein
MKQHNNKKLSKEHYLKYSLLGVAIMIVAMLVYVLVIRPSSPDYVFKAAVESTFNTDKNKSGRFDGTYSETNSGLAVEFSGSSSGDQSLAKTRISVDGQKVDFETYNNSIVRFSGAGQYKYVLGKLSDKPVVVDPNIESIVAELDSKWLDISAGNLGKVARDSLCVNDTLSSAFSSEQITEILKNKPYEIVSGPYSDTGDAGSSVFEIKIRDAESISGLPFVRSFLGQSECISNVRASDYKTRTVGTKDIEMAVVKVHINTSNNTITRITAKQVGVFFTFNIRDLGKDVVVARPDNMTTIDVFAQSLSADQQAALLDVFVSKVPASDSKQ